MTSIGSERRWLEDILLSDSETEASEISDEDEYIKDMLRNHVREKKYRAKYYQSSNVSFSI